MYISSYTYIDILPEKDSDVKSGQNYMTIAL